MTAEEYIKEAMRGGTLTLTHIANFVRDFQDTYDIRPEDGKPGPKTLTRLAKVFPPIPETPGKFIERLPLPTITGRNGARKPRITSSFRPADRPDHDGCDFFYRWEAGDKPNFTGDGGCEGKNADGTPKWVVPYGTDAMCVAPGTVQLAGPSPTGYRCWVNHGNGLRTGYFHLETLYVKAGDVLQPGSVIGLVGHNPSPAVDGRHLHFEVSLVEKYEPQDPSRYFKDGLL